MKFSVRGQTPYVELDGQQYPDSNLIMDMLKERKMGVDPEEAAGVSKDDGKLALAHMAR